MDEQKQEQKQEQKVDEQLKTEVAGVLQTGEQEMGGLNLAACYGCGAGASVSYVVPAVAIHTVALVGDIVVAVARRAGRIGADIHGVGRGAFNKAHIRLHPRTVFRLGEVAKERADGPERETAVKQICQLLRVKDEAFRNAYTLALKQEEAKTDITPSQEAGPGATPLPLGT